VLTHGYPVEHGDHPKLCVCAFTHLAKDVLAHEPYTAVPHLCRSQFVSGTFCRAASGAPIRHRRPAPGRRTGLGGHHASSTLSGAGSSELSTGLMRTPGGTRIG
jgi:hypothetical protein